MSELIGEIQGKEGLGTAVDGAAEESAIEMALASFEKAAEREAERVLEQPGLVPETRKRVLALLREARAGFLWEVRDELIDAKADGLLTRAELSEEITEAREYILEDFRVGLRAALDGSRRPPTLEDAEGPFDYAAEIAHYIVFERNPPRAWGILAAWIGGAIALALLLSLTLKRLAERISERSWIRGGFEVLRSPLLLIAFAAGLSIGRDQIWLPVMVEDTVAVLVKLVAFVGAFWLWWRISGRIALGIVRMFGVVGSARNEAVDVVRKTLRLAGLGVLTVCVAKFGFGTDVSALLAAVGVISIAASVAAQDTLRNLVASLTIHGDRPFVLGDLVRFQDRLGTVEEIGFRSTRLRMLDGPVVVIPNGDLVRESLENLSARRHVRHHYAIDLVYGTPPDKVSEAVGILEEILGARDRPEGHEPHVAFDGYGPYNLRIGLWFTSNTGDYFEAKKDRGEVNLEILRRFGDAELEFAFPTHTLHVASGDEDPPSEAPS